MNITLLSPQDRRYVQGMTSPSLLVHVEDAFCPDPTSASVQLDLVDSHTWDRVVDGSSGTIATITSEVLSYGTVYDFYLQHDWDAADLNRFGVYDFQFKVTFVSGEVMMFPQHPITMTITPRAAVATPITPTATVSQEPRVDDVNSFVAGDIIYNDGAVWQLADASDHATLGTNIVTQAEASFFYYAGPGCVITFAADQGWTEGSSVYLNPAADGKLTQTMPTSAAFPGQWGQSLGGADSDRSFSFQNYAPWRL